MSMTATARPISTRDLAEAAECLRTMAHPVRLRILQLAAAKAHTVGDLADACHSPSAKMSGHLRLMKDRGLLDSERRGRQIYYWLAEPAARGILRCIEHRFDRRKAK
jgi:DNA-binding transcriptional ArsR family regulator